jgi:hypothetical protein
MQFKIIAAFAALCIAVAVLLIIMPQRVGYGDTPAGDNAFLENITLLSLADSSIEGFDIGDVLGFDTGIFEYTVHLPYDFGTFAMGFAAYNRAATAVAGFDGAAPVWAIQSFERIVSANFTSDAGTLNVRYIPAGGESTITITITSEDGTSSQTYVVRYIRQSTEEAQAAGHAVTAVDNARLLFIRLTPFAGAADAVENFNLELSPAFDSDIFDYTVYLPDDADAFRMNFIPYNRRLSARVYKNGEEFWVADRFVRNAANIGFTAGPDIQAMYIPADEETVMTIVITSWDGATTETYTVRFIR